MPYPRQADPQAFWGAPATSAAFTGGLRSLEDLVGWDLDSGSGLDQEMEGLMRWPEDDGVKEEEAFAVDPRRLVKVEEEAVMEQQIADEVLASFGMAC